MFHTMDQATPRLLRLRATTFVGSSEREVLFGGKKVSEQEFRRPQYAPPPRTTGYLFNFPAF
jgi:hypothetical protein